MDHFIKKNQKQEKLLDSSYQGLELIKNSKCLFLNNLNLIKNQILTFKAEINRLTIPFIQQKKNQIMQIKQQLNQFLKTEQINFKQLQGETLLILKKQLEEQKNYALELKNRHFLFVQMTIKEAEENRFQMESVIMQIQEIQKNQHTESQIKVDNSEYSGLRFDQQTSPYEKLPLQGEKKQDETSIQKNFMDQSKDQKIKQQGINLTLENTIPKKLIDQKYNIKEKLFESKKEWNLQQKNNRSMILLKSEADTQTVSLPLGYNRLEKIQMQCRITEKTPSLCLINHQLIELYIQEYQTQSSNSLSLKCFCGKKLCQYHIIEPRNRIFYQSIMEKQLKALIWYQPHLKCQSNSCNFKVIYNANLGKVQSHYYCPMCNEKCPFHFIV